MGHEVLRLADAFGRRVQEVERRSASAIEQVGGEVARMSQAMDERLDPQRRHGRQGAGKAGRRDRPHHRTSGRTHRQRRTALRPGNGRRRRAGHARLRAPAGSARAHLDRALRTHPPFRGAHGAAARRRAAAYRPAAGRDPAQAGSPRPRRPPPPARIRPQRLRRSGRRAVRPRTLRCAHAGVRSRGRPRRRAVPRRRLRSGRFRRRVHADARRPGRRRRGRGLRFAEDEPATRPRPTSSSTDSAADDLLEPAPAHEDDDGFAKALAAAPAAGLLEDDEADAFDVDDVFEAAPATAAERHLETARFDDEDEDEFEHDRFDELRHAQAEMAAHEAESKHEAEPDLGDEIAAAAEVPATDWTRPIRSRRTGPALHPRTDRAGPRRGARSPPKPR